MNAEESILRVFLYSHDMLVLLPMPASHKRSGTGIKAS